MSAEHFESVKVHIADIKNEFNCFNGYCTIDHTMPPWKIENEKEFCWFSGKVAASRSLEPNDIQQPIQFSTDTSKLVIYIIHVVNDMQINIYQ